MNSYARTPDLRTLTVQQLCQSSPIFEQFSQYVLQNEDECAEALKKGFIAIDTNVLLNLYKYDEGVTNNWLQTLQHFGNRLWIPHHVLKEFWNARSGLVGSPDTKSSKGKIESYAEEIRREFEGWLETQAVASKEEYAQLLDEVTRSAEKLTAILQESIDTHNKRFDHRVEEDEIVQALALMTSKQSESSANVCPSFTEQELEEIYTEGKERFEKEIPPGYKDDQAHNKNGKKDDKQYGDLVVWKEILRLAKNLNADSTESTYPYVVFVTGDLKDDWWERIKIDDVPEAKRFPRKELVQEMYTHTASRYIQLTPQGFIEAVQREFPELGISDETVTATAKSAVETTAYPDEFYITVWGKVRATATIHTDGRCVVQAGSVTDSGWAPSMPKSYRDLALKLEEEGVLKFKGDDRSTENGPFEFTENYTFTSPSAASSVVKGAATNGNQLWKTDTGETLGEYRSARDEDSE